MRLYDFKRGHKKTLDDIASIMEELFGEVRSEEGRLIASYGALEKIEVWLEGSKMAVETTSKRVDNATAQDTLKRWNEFLFCVTGYTAKERKKKMSKT
ncbi:hypothetical protein B6U71_02015 [Euryarchaeota archaeon ex4484_178]|nr:MAG: hypothetical protein B6U71_02015 [Euryarchaeota archaeon ex4484_178]